MSLKTRLAFVVAMVVMAAHPCLADHPASGFAHTVGGPIITIPATTLPARRWSAGVRVEYVRFQAFSNQELEDAAVAGEDLHSLDALFAPSLAIAYGLTERLTLGARLPYVSRYGLREGHLEGVTPEVHEHGTARGLGDVTLLAQYRLTREELQDFAFQLGFKLPTGATDVVDDDGVLFDVNHQPGSGSLDPMVGASWTEQTFAGSVDANFMLTLVTKGARETNLGQLFNFNVAISHLVLSSRTRADDEPERGVAVHLVAEANGELREQEGVAGVRNENSGGTLLYFTPGLRVSAGTQWSMGVSLGFPVLQDLHGRQHETQIRPVAALGILF